MPKPEKSQKECVIHSVSEFAPFRAFFPDLIKLKKEIDLPLCLLVSVFFHKRGNNEQNSFVLPVQILSRTDPHVKQTLVLENWLFCQ